ncbi:MAG: D-alanyl-D-alanine carboxypeptidase, partial [Sporomusaceae bacterium]|nr:D-alanyl-D-alanine carboxypeptidase [Sporomusaceae bacterium]
MFRLGSFKIMIIWVCMLFLVSTCHSALAAEPKKPMTAELETTAQSAILMDGNGTVLYERNSHKR